MNNQHEAGFIKAFVLVFGALVFFTLSIAVLANWTSPDFSDQDPLVQAQLQDRLAPVGQSRVAQ